MVQDYYPTLTRELFQRQQTKSYFSEHELLKCFTDICMAMKQLLQKNVFKHRLTSRSVFMTGKDPISIKVGGFLEPYVYLKHATF